MPETALDALRRILDGLTPDQRGQVLAILRERGYDPFGGGGLRPRAGGPLIVLVLALAAVVGIVIAYLIVELIIWWQTP